MGGSNASEAGSDSEHGRRVASDARPSLTVFWTVVVAALERAEALETLPGREACEEAERIDAASAEIEVWLAGLAQEVHAEVDG